MQPSFRFFWCAPRFFLPSLVIKSPATAPAHVPPFRSPRRVSLPWTVALGCPPPHPFPAGLFSRSPLVRPAAPPLYSKKPGSGGLPRSSRDHPSCFRPEEPCVFFFFARWAVPPFFRNPLCSQIAEARNGPMLPFCPCLFPTLCFCSS